MGVVAIEELKRHLAGGRTLAGLDLGDKTIGVAVSDRGLSFAHPRPVIMRKKFSLDAAALLSLLEKENAGAVVIGLPVNMDGSEGPRAQKSRAFVRNMAPLTALPFAFWDERLSTVA
ncbi:MAG TPA: Holliday junction resolvase RuvX, partial [Mesorhizobium sp.]|nr:Holliday junction resolvase RuvX [Mesorhizobium sp.]